MGSGDLTASTPVFSNTEAALKTAIDALNLAIATDRLVVLPHNGGFLSFQFLIAAYPWLCLYALFVVLFCLVTAHPNAVTIIYVIWIANIFLDGD